MESEENLAALAERIAACHMCGLAKGRGKTVPGDGAPDADIMFIGEAPGFYEDREGVPFVGRAGNLLNEMLASINLRRADVFITNMVKCRPPNNRDPFPAEIAACAPYLDEQIEAVRPKVIVALGRYSFSKFFPNEAISKARGKPRDWRGIVVYPMYHPAAALRNGNLKARLQDDFSRLPDLIREVESGGARQMAQETPTPAPAAKQIGLFQST